MAKEPQPFTDEQIKDIQRAINISIQHGNWDIDYFNTVDHYKVRGTTECIARFLDTIAAKSEILTTQTAEIERLRGALEEIGSTTKMRHNPLGGKNTGFEYERCDVCGNPVSLSTRFANPCYIVNPDCEGRIARHALAKKK